MMACSGPLANVNVHGPGTSMINRIAVITGASSGFGLLTTVELARRGFRVFATMRDLGRADRLRQALADDKVQAELVELDVRSPESVAAAIAEIERRAGRIDVLVNNAGIMVTGFCEDLSEQELREQFETNFFGAIRVTKAVIPGMRERCFGRIVNVSSLGGRLANPMFAAYHSSKFALEGWSEALRHELRPYNVYVSLVEPGLFPTGLFKDNWSVAGRSGDPQSPNFGASQRLVAAFRVGIGFASLADPSTVARTIATAATCRQPKLRYLVGLDAKLTYGFARLFPRWWEAYMAALTCPPEE